MRDEVGSEGAARRSGFTPGWRKRRTAGSAIWCWPPGGSISTGTRTGASCGGSPSGSGRRAPPTSVPTCAWWAAIPIEREHLVKALTIHVSQFLRNPTTFRAIQTEVLPAILADKARIGGRALRLWSVGCACGEEPYSLALLLSEMASETVRRYSTTIYGTDIEPECLRVAREGAVSRRQPQIRPGPLEAAVLHAGGARLRGETGDPASRLFQAAQHPRPGAVRPDRSRGLPQRPHLHDGPAPGTSPAATVRGAQLRGGTWFWGRSRGWPGRPGNCSSRSTFRSGSTASAATRRPSDRPEDWKPSGNRAFRLTSSFRVRYFTRHVCAARVRM